jgi:ABC-type multidrug transport system fused ATPase/permease subunit
MKLFERNGIGGLQACLSEEATAVETAFGFVEGRSADGCVAVRCGNHLRYRVRVEDGLDSGYGLCYLPVLAIVVSGLGPMMMRAGGAKQKHTAASMTIAEGVLSSMRAVKASNREDEEYSRFVRETESSAKAERKMELVVAGMMCTMMLSMWVFPIMNM